jgi:hypothetical protein
MHAMILSDDEVLTAIYDYERYIDHALNTALWAEYDRQLRRSFSDDEWDDERGALIESMNREQKGDRGSTADHYRRRRTGRLWRPRRRSTDPPLRGRHKKMS